MNVFVLCTGRCGSVTFAKACSHFANFTSGHESLAHSIGDARLAYPQNHIEVDNRLSWFLGRLDRTYGRDAYYVHLTRDPEAVATSFSNRLYRKGGIGRAYRETIVISGRGQEPPPPLEAMRDYVRTVTENIEMFLKDKPNVMSIRLEEIDRSFPEFCSWISAEGDLDAAMREWAERHNASPEGSQPSSRIARSLRRRVNELLGRP